MDDPFAPLEPSASAHERPAVAEAVCVAPVPAGAPPAPPAIRGGRLPSASWVYRAHDGAVLGFQHRFDSDGRGKAFMPQTLWRAPDGALEWRLKKWPAPAPLYGLETLSADHVAEVVIVEGEKSADAVRRMDGARLVVTSPGGANAAHTADWSPLRGRDVTIWPDADAAGARYASEVAQRVTDAGARSVRVAAAPAGATEGWDGADAEAEGWDAARVAELLASAIEWRPPATAAATSRPPKKKAGEGGQGATERGPSIQKTMIRVARACRFWRDSDGVAYAFLPVGDHEECWRLRSDPFKRWLTSRTFDASGDTPSGNALEDVLRLLEAQAYEGAPLMEPWLRVGGRDGKIYLDLADEAWRVVEIDRDGWRLYAGVGGLPFVRRQSMRALPSPEAGYEIDELKAFVNVAHDDDFTMLCGWLLAALRPRGPYPILVLNGEQGSGKSSCSRYLRSLVDPSKAPIRAAPKDLRDLQVGADNSHVLAFDNLSSVPVWLADGFCRISTGGGFASRALYADREEMVFDATRPLLLNGIPSLVDRADVADRAITIRLREIAESERRSEEDMERQWLVMQPRILGALLDGVSAALRYLPEVQLPAMPRMADLARWVTAAEPGLGLEPGSFVAVYTANRADASRATFDADPVAVAVASLMKFKPNGWDGTPTELLAALNGHAAEDVKKLKLWPKTAQNLSNRLDRAAPVLRVRGFHVQRSKSGSRNIAILPLGGGEQS
jgi:putative DNA primase/helicase